MGTVAEEAILCVSSCFGHNVPCSLGHAACGDNESMKSAPE